MTDEVPDETGARLKKSSHKFLVQLAQGVQYSRTLWKVIEIFHLHPYKIRQFQVVEMVVREERTF
jgi:hypothetical protein